MTLIANTSNYNCDILIGDILMTSETRGQEVGIPTFLGGVDAQLPPEQNFYPYSLRQKIYVIEDQLAVGFAGYESEIKPILEDLRTYFRYKQVTFDNLKAFLNDWDLTQFSNSAAYILIAEKNERATIIQHCMIGAWSKGASKTYEEVTACGTGTADFIKAAAQSIIASGEGNTNHLHETIALNYILLIKILGNERLSLDTIKNYWGAGFEMIYYDENSFKKVDDITFLFWNGTLDLETGAFEVQPFLILNYKYYEDLLVINASNGYTFASQGVLPFYLTKDDIDKSKLPETLFSNAPKVCSAYFIELSNGKTSTPAFFTERDESLFQVQVDIDEEKHLRIMISTALQEQLMAILNRLIAQNKIN